MSDACTADRVRHVIDIVSIRLFLYTVRSDSKDPVEVSVNPRVDGVVIVEHSVQRGMTQLGAVDEFP